MTKRVFELDDELFASARAELGTAGVSDTVRAALRHAVASSARAPGAMAGRRWTRKLDRQDRAGRRVAVVARYVIDTSGGRNRGLLTAVIASEHDLTVVHYDADFDIAGSVIEFPNRWVAPRGSL